MKEQQRLPLIFLFSLIVHALILYIIPVFELEPLPSEAVYEVKLIKPEPKKQAVSDKGNKKSKGASGTKQVTGETKKKIDYAGFKRPDMVLPSVTTDEKVFIPESIVENDNVSGSSSTPGTVVDVNKELAKASKSFEKSKGTIDDAKGVKGAVYSSSDFFAITSLSDHERTLLNKPAPPKYSLENDTSIQLKFYVDKYGMPTRISYVTRSDSTIEKLAFDYVNKLRFGAVDYDTPDAVEIKLFFKVK